MRRAAGSLASVMMALVVLVPASPAAAATERPPDVARSTFYTEPVLWLLREGITRGAGPNGEYLPNDIVTRGQMAAFLFRAAGEPNGSPLASFTDVPSSAFYKTAVDWLVDERITLGTTATTFEPDLPVTRGQMAAFLHRNAGTPGGSPASGFSDVPSSAFYKAAVDWLVDEKITLGLTPTTFAPDAPVTRAQMAAFLHREAGSPGVATPPAPPHRITRFGIDSIAWGTSFDDARAALELEPHTEFDFSRRTCNGIVMNIHDAVDGLSVGFIDDQMAYASAASFPSEPNPADIMDVIDLGDTDAVLDSIFPGQYIAVSKDFPESTIDFGFGPITIPAYTAYTSRLDLGDRHWATFSHVDDDPTYSTMAYHSPYDIQPCGDFVVRPPWRD